MSDATKSQNERVKENTICQGVNFNECGCGVNKVLPCFERRWVFLKEGSKKPRPTCKDQGLENNDKKRKKCRGECDSYIKQKTKCNKECSCLCKCEFKLSYNLKPHITAILEKNGWKNKNKLKNHPWYYDELDGSFDVDKAVHEKRYKKFHVNEGGNEVSRHAHYFIQVHHLIPISIFKSSTLRNFGEKACFDVNAAENLVVLPVTDIAACQLKVPKHRGNHPNTYYNYCAEYCEKELVEYEKNIKSSEKCQSSRQSDELNGYLAQFRQISVHILERLKDFEQSLTTDYQDYRCEGEGCESCKKEGRSHHNLFKGEPSNLIRDHEDGLRVGI